MIKPIYVDKEENVFVMKNNNNLWEVCVWNDFTGEWLTVSKNHQTKEEAISWASIEENVTI